MAKHVFFCEKKTGKLTFVKNRYLNRLNRYLMKLWPIQLFANDTFNKIITNNNQFKTDIPTDHNFHHNFVKYCDIAKEIIAYTAVCQR